MFSFIKKFPLQGRTLALLAVVIPLLGLFIYVGLRSGPLAPVAVTVTTVESKAIMPALFGIGTVDVRYHYKIGPTSAGRIKKINVHVGDNVTAGQVLGEMDAVDLDDKLRSQQSLIKRTEAVLHEAQARHTFAKTQASRYQQLYKARSASQEVLVTKQQELQVAQAALTVAQEDLVRALSDAQGVAAQKNSLRFITPVAGVVIAREFDPGSTVVGGQTVIEVIDDASLWVNVRFDQISAFGLAAELPAQIALRSRAGQLLPGRVVRVERKADTVTEEMLAKVVFDQQPIPLPPLGELAEVTVNLSALPITPVIPNAAIQRINGKVGVWTVQDASLQFTEVTLGAADLEGNVQVIAGLTQGEQIVLYSEKALTPTSRVTIVTSSSGGLK